MIDKRFRQWLESKKHITWFNYMWLEQKEQSKLWKQFFDVECREAE